MKLVCVHNIIIGGCGLGGACVHSKLFGFTPMYINTDISTDFNIPKYAGEMYVQYNNTSSMIVGLLYGIFMKREMMVILIAEASNTLS